MQRRDFLVGTCAAGLALAAREAQGAAPSRGDINARFDAALTAAQRRVLSAEPEQATILGFSAADAGSDALRRWGEYGLEGRAKRRARLQSVVDALAPFPVDQLDPRRAGVKRVLTERAEGWLALEAASGQGHLSPWGVIWGFEPYPINQISGLHIGGPNLLVNYHPVETRQDAEAYVQRLRTLGGALDGVRAEAVADAALLAPPRRVIEGARDVVRSFLAVAPDVHPVTASFRARLQAAGLDAKWASQAERAFARDVRPAYQRLAEALEDMAQNAPEGLGLSHRPNGAEAYQLSLRMQADTALSPQEVHEIGLEESRRLSEALTRALDAFGVPAGAIPDRLDALSQRPGQLYPDSDEGRGRLLDDLRTMTARANERIAGAFARVAARPPTIRRIPIFLEAYASGGGGQPPSLDGRKPGVFVINLKDMGTVARWSLPPLAYHEATPGHIYEGEIAMSGGHPALQLFLARSNAFAEGWAMYAEKLAGELGFYEGMEGAEIGRLRSEQFRAVRLVVDTGLHHFGWSFDRAVDFMVSAGAANRQEASREVVRYAVWPGQALGYKLGMRAIEQARSDAESRLGPNFSLKAFHSALLGTGGVPIPELVAAARRL